MLADLQGWSHQRCLVCDPPLEWAHCLQVWSSPTDEICVGLIDSHLCEGWGNCHLTHDCLDKGHGSGTFPPCLYHPQYSWMVEGFWQSVILVEIGCSLEILLQPAQVQHDLRCNGTP